MRWSVASDSAKMRRQGHVSIQKEEKKMTEFRVRGAFFESEKDYGPAFTGFVEIDGVKTRLALWPKTSVSGQNYFQVAEDKKKGAPPVNAPPVKSPFKPRGKPAPVQGNDPRDSDMDDDIPF